MACRAWHSSSPRRAAGWRTCKAPSPSASPGWPANSGAGSTSRVGRSSRAAPRRGYARCGRPLEAPRSAPEATLQVLRHAEVMLDDRQGLAGHFANGAAWAALRVAADDALRRFVHANLLVDVGAIEIASILGAEVAHHPLLVAAQRRRRRRRHYGAADGGFQPLRRAGVVADHLCREAANGGISRSEEHT